MAQKSLIKNVIYNFIYTSLNLLYPLITAPYVSRILGASNLGKVNFATIIVNWFILFAVFGTSTYGVREIAKVRDDRVQLNRVFSEIFFINGLMSLVVTLIYIISIFNVEQFRIELPLFLIMSISIVLNMFSIDWFFQGIEEYKYITIRNAIIKVISLICMFMFVNQSEHYVIYGLISVLATGLSGVLNLIYSRRFIKIEFVSINLLKHMKPLRIFFLHTFMINIYTHLDQVLLGFFIDTKSVAFMNRAKAIVTVATSISTAVSNATLPRASYYIENDKKKFLQLLREVPNYILWITIPITMGCISLSYEIMYLLGGEEFLEANILLQIIALTIIFAPLSTYLQYQVLVASGEEKLGLYAAILTSLISLVLNIILIPVIGFIGAGLVQVVSQVSAVAIRVYISRKMLGYSDIKFINKSTISFLFASLLMGGFVIYIKHLIDDILISFLVGSLVGSIVYLIVLLLVRERITLLIIGKIKLRFGK